MNSHETRNEALLHDIEAWLTTKQTAMWGDGYIITADDSRRKAADWFRRQMIDFNNWQHNKYAPNIEISPHHNPVAWEAGAWDVVTEV